MRDYFIGVFAVLSCSILPMALFNIAQDVNPDIVIIMKKYWSYSAVSIIVVIGSLLYVTRNTKEKD